MRRKLVAWAFLPGWMAVLLSAGCFNPRVQSGGFACDPTQPQPCPSGFYCVAHRCVDHPAAPGSGGDGGDVDLATGGDDLATPPAGDMAPAGGDMAGPPPADMAQPPPPPDMAQTSTCAHDKCKSGGRLKSSCDPCVQQVCSVDPYCCQLEWDEICVVHVTTICGLSCP